MYKEKLINMRGVIQTEIEGLVALAEKNSRNFSKAEDKRFNALIEEAKTFDARIAQIEDDESAANANSNAHKRFATTTVTEARTYHEHSNNSFFRDYFNAKRNGDTEASERLQNSANESRTALGTGALPGGDFSIPDYMVEDFVALARPSRVVSNLVRNRDLPTGYSSIAVPKITGGTSVLPQAVEGDLISLQNATSQTLTSPVITLAGGQIINQQLLDQSPISMDTTILEDLAADYAKAIEGQVLSGSGTNGNLTGLLTNSEINTITYTSSTPSVVGTGNLYAKISQAIASIHDTRFSPPTAILMTPSRWAWFASAQDSSGRPLVTPTANDNAAFNALGTSGALSAGGAVGFLLGVPVYVTAVLPKNLGAGTNQDKIVVLRADDVELFESKPRLEVLPQIYGANLQVLVRYYSYAALIIRNAKGVSAIGGTGLVYPPTF